MNDDDQPAPVVLVDACVLVPIRLTTTLLALAEAWLFEVLWSGQILDVVESNLPKVRVSPAAAARRVAAMRDGFGETALVDDFAELIDTMTCDAKDRHVLAATVKGKADDLQRPAITMRAFLASLAIVVPNFAGGAAKLATNSEPRTDG